jgi:hypothetical protein
MELAGGVARRNETRRQCCPVEVWDSATVLLSAAMEEE